MANQEMHQREKAITKTSVIGIVANVFLAAFKAGAGLFAGSIAIVLDAVNNLSDALSSIITIAGIRLARKAPDKKHPFGYGRIEYFSAIIISLIVLAAGATSFFESAKKLFSKDVPEYSTVTIVIIVVAVITKLVLGRFVKAQGEKYNSDALIASGSDASFDAILSASTLLGAVAAMLWHISIDAYLGIVIAFFIVKAGMEMLMQPLNQVVGFRTDSAITTAIRETVESFDAVEGAYDLVIHNYGPDYAIGSIHIEVADNMSSKQIHALSKDIQHAVYTQYNIFLTIGIYAVDGENETVGQMRAHIKELALSQSGVLGVHGIFIDETKKILSFDAVLDFEARNEGKLPELLTEKIKKQYPEYDVVINIDLDFSD